MSVTKLSFSFFFDDIALERNNGGSVDVSIRIIKFDYAQEVGRLHEQKTELFRIELHGELCFAFFIFLSNVT